MSLRCGELYQRVDPVSLDTNRLSHRRILKAVGKYGNTGVGRKHESSGSWRVKSKEDLASFSGDWEPLELIMENV